MSDMDIDLNINNYTFSEMLKVFKFRNIDDVLFHLQNAQMKMKNLLLVIEENFSDEVLEFYTKIYKIIIIIATLCDIPNMLDKKDTISINYYIEKIKQVDSFETKDIEEILTDPKFTNEYDKQEYNIFREDTRKSKIRQNNPINKYLEKYSKKKSDIDENSISPEYLEQPQTSVLNTEYNTKTATYTERVPQNPALNNSNHII
jgi:hypothetical protein